MQGAVSPGSELLEGLLGVFASSGHRGAEAGLEGDGRAGHQGLDSGTSSGAGEGAASGNTEEGGRHDCVYVSRKSRRMELVMGCWKV